MAEEQVDILLQLKNLQQFVTGTQRAGESVSGLGTKAEQASVKTVSSARKVPGVIGMIGRAARSSAVATTRTAPIFRSFFRGIERGATSAVGFIRRRFVSLRESIGRTFKGHGGLGIGSLAGGAALSYLSFSGLKTAVDNTAQLGVVSANTSKVTGMTTQSLATLFALAQAHGVSVGQMAMSFRLLSNNIESAGTGSKTSVALFNKLGISANQLKSANGNLGNVLGLVLDRFDKLPSGVTKTYIASKLFGRSWQNLLPIIGRGSKELQHQQAVAKMLGVTMGGNPVQAAEKLHNAQIYLKLASMGLQIFIATKLLPVLLWLYAHLLKTYLIIRQKVGPVYAWFKGVLQTVVAWLHRHKDIVDALKTALSLLVPILIAVKLAQIAWNIAMLDNPFTWVILAIVALVTAIIYAWKHSQTFRDIVKKVWADIQMAAKWAWENVLKPVFHALAAAWDWVKQAAINAWPVIKTVWHAIAGAATWAWTNVLKPVFHFIVNVIRNVLVPVFKLVAAVFKVAWKIITTVVSLAWTILRPILKAIGWVISNLIVPVVKFLWMAFKTAFGIIAAVVSWAWHNVIHPALSGIQGLIRWLGGAVGTVGGAFKTAFKIIGDAISWTYNHTLKPFVDALKTAVSLLPSLGVKGKATIQPGYRVTPGGAVVKTTVAGSTASTPLSGHRAFGGPIFRTGRYLVGERGPEIISLPSGARVTPMAVSEAKSFQTRPTSMTSARFNLEVPVVIERREVARAVASFRDDTAARR